MMAAADVEIKTEPLDEDFVAIKQEELIIKPEFDVELVNNHTQEYENDLQNSLDMIIPRDEPFNDDQYLNTVDDSTSMEADQSPCKPAPKKKFTCDICDRYFTSAWGLSRHSRLRCRKENKCAGCGQIFRTNLVLKNHMCHHRQKQKYILPKTGKAVRDTEVVLFACNVCSATFSTAKALQQHNRDHVEYIHVCNKCGKAYKQPTDLRRHKKNIKSCADDKIESVLPDSVIKIKEEVEDEGIDDEFVANQMVIGSTAIKKVQNPKVQEVFVDSKGRTFTIKSEDLNSETEIVEVGVPQPTAFIKVEPNEIKKEIQSNDSMDYDELILQELIDRKAKSIAKERKALVGSKASIKIKSFNSIKCIFREDLPTMESTDFEEVIATNTLAVTKQNGTSVPVEDLYLAVSKEENLYESSDDNQHSNMQEDFQQVEDFEDMIESNTLVNFHNKVEVIENLKEEYQKAKKKPHEGSTDESSQHSSSAGTVNTSVPCSMYLTLMSDSEQYNEAIRKLDKRYRYTWVCSWCPQRYLQRYSFIKHLLKVHNKLVDELTNQLFELKPELLSRATEVENSYCPLCRVTLADADSLEKHKNEFHKEANKTKLQFKCDKCGKFCSTRSTLADHVQANCGTEPQYGCDECGKKFHTKSTLNLHKTMHTGELPHECEYCDKRFRTRGQLTVHTRTHTGERPFPCKVCERRFTHRETLIAHLSRHIDMKRYKCYGCQMFFSCISGLKTHRLTRMSTCGKVKLNARAVGPRVRVIKGNVIFEPQPKINPYYRRHDDNQNRTRDRENINDYIKIEHMAVENES